MLQKCEAPRNGGASRNSFGEQFRDLFSGLDSPPQRPSDTVALPGSKGPDGTSQAAARSMAPSVDHLRRRALETLDRLGSATPLEAVAASGIGREALQPRFSELRAAGLVEPTGERRANPSGRSAAVLRLTAAGRDALRGTERPA